MSNGRIRGPHLPARVVAVLLSVMVVALAGCQRQPLEPPTAPSEIDIFPAFWPVSSEEEARNLQEQVDAGMDEWLKDPASVAGRFAAEYIGWEISEVEISGTSGSQEEGWHAEVRFRPMVGEPPNLIPGNLHLLKLFGIAGTDEPAWLVASLRSSRIEVDSPADREAVVSPMRVAGRGAGFEGTINTRVLDDEGRELHPRAGREEGFLTAGSMEIAPFDEVVNYEAPATPAGVLILTGATGVEGPPPDWTIVRLGFAEE